MAVRITQTQQLTHQHSDSLTLTLLSLPCSLRSAVCCVSRTPFLRDGAMVFALILVTMKPFLRPTAIPDMALDV